VQLNVEGSRRTFGGCSGSELWSNDVAFVLAVDMAGVPSRWLVVEEAITYQARHMVAWSLGDEIAKFRGGYSRKTGERSEISTQSIIAIKGAIDKSQNEHPCLTNSALFSRDRRVCAYCGDRYRERELSRDHIKPVHAGGADRWMNVVTACRPCNIRKGGRTPEQANMPLIYTPYVPNRYEHLILQNRRILQDQMEYLMAKVPQHSRLFA
jgi:5-methylcytosine-specific restriction endonuclease McrA